jgi:hypothetical protein
MIDGSLAVDTWMEEILENLLKWQVCTREPAPASAPSTGCLLLFSCDGWMVPNNRILFLGGGCPAPRICNLIASTCFSSSGRGGKKHVKKYMSLRNHCGNLFLTMEMSLS